MPKPKNRLSPAATSGFPNTLAPQYSVSTRISPSSRPKHCTTYNQDTTKNFNLAERGEILSAVIELGRARVGVVGQVLSGLEGAAVLEEDSDSSSAEGVIANRFGECSPTGEFAGSCICTALLYGGVYGVAERYCTIDFNGDTFVQC
ncbi:MAG: hypothetical protein ACR2JB_28840 [Bryobacteraceae bacterium]